MEAALGARLIAKRTSRCAAIIRVEPNIVALDGSVPGERGLTVLPHLRAALPQAITIVISTHCSPSKRSNDRATSWDEKGSGARTKSNTEASRGKTVIKERVVPVSRRNRKLLFG